MSGAVEYLRGKYWKPASLTWLISFGVLLAGAFKAAEPVHHFAAWVEVIDNLSGHKTAADLITAGLFGIGIRGAL